MPKQERKPETQAEEMVLKVKNGLFKVAFHPPLKSAKIPKATSTGIVHLHMEGSKLKSVDYFAGLYGQNVESALENFETEQNFIARRLNRQLVNEIPEQPQLHLSPEFMRQLLQTVRQ